MKRTISLRNLFASRLAASLKHSSRACVARILVLVLVLVPTMAVAAPDKKKASNHPVSKKVSPSGKPKILVARPQATLAGQTLTQLPDGRWLLIGGESENGPQDVVAFNDPRTGLTVASRTKLQHARAWHSATMLPDGQVLILGGIGKNGALLKSAELFNPATQSSAPLPTQQMGARAYHAANLLTDGQILISGGATDDRDTPGNAFLWDFKTKAFRALSANISSSRQKHKVTLLYDGNLLIEGGTDAGGTQVTTTELFNVSSGSFSFTSMSAEQMDQASAFLSGSLPANGADEVPVDALIALRFSKRLTVQSLNAESVTLSGPDGTIETKVVPAEGGRLAFLTPQTSLQAGTAYTATVSGATDETGVMMARASITFVTKANQQPDSTNGDGEDWIPNTGNLNGDWRSRRPDSPWQKLPPLAAADGVTALAGQLLVLNGNPLENVTLHVGSVSSRSDHTGRFLLTGLSAGHHVLKVDGRSASKPGKTYGVFKIGIDIVAGRTNPLSFTIWMPKLDTRNTVTVQWPTSQEVAITSPHIPGLKVNLPAGAIVRDTDGQIANRISITPIPVDRPPFPLPPNSSVPVFFTVQPGGAQVIPPRARVIYPNYTHLRPATRVDFWNYDPEGKGWYIYGKGTVSADGKEVVPDAGVVIYEFTGFMVDQAGNPAGTGPRAGNGPGGQGGDPVDLGTGLFVMEKTDLYLPDTVPLLLRRTYRPGDNQSRAFGIGSTHPYEMFLYSVNNWQEADLILPDGGRIYYQRISPGSLWLDAVYEHTKTPSAFYKSKLSWNGSGWDVRLKDGTVYIYPDMGPMKAVRDRFGNQLNITRSNGNYGIITKLTSPNGRWIQFTNDSSNRITQAQDNIGRTVSYTYDSSGRLATVTDPKGGVTQYTYDSSNRMTTIRDARNIVFLTNQYDANGRVTLQTQADGSIFQFAYTVDGSGKITQTDVTDPRGNIRRVTFNADGFIVSETRALGTSVQQTFTYERQSGSNLVLSVTDPLLRKTTLTYDTMGNVTSFTRLADTANAVTTTMTYESAFNERTSVTDPLGHTSTFGYNSKGGLTSITDPLSNQTKLTYNPYGQAVSITDPLQNTFQFSYDGGDLAGITNPLGHTYTRYVDAAGRLLKVINELGQQTRYENDSLDQIVSIQNPLLGTTAFTYDANGNLSSVTDAKGNVTNYTYNNMDLVSIRRNPVPSDDLFAYNPNGYRSQITDHKGQVIFYTYDALDRMTQVTYGDSSTTSFAYNAADRLTQVTDSLSGTISYSYDNLDRVTSQVTPQGTISYTYDAAGRRTSMTVAGQPTISYTYDNADRLTQITQGSAVVTMAYDAAGRRTSSTLPNGVVVQYAYNAASKVTVITYQHNSVTLGNLTYEYDATGRRIRVGGTYSRSGLPQAMASSTYNSRNQLTQRGSQTFTYDANGNLLNDGVNTYTWNARDQLTATSGGSSASFEYDGFGRRTAKTTGGSSVGYLYDGLNVVQELSGASPTANFLTARIDEVFARSDAAGLRCPLVAGVNSTIGLTDDTGAQVTQYTYEPFGGTSVTGAASTNAFQFTGRENDGDGLYYYRARYYSPLFQRFISEDPIGFRSGDVNFYAYVRNDPINWNDPSGLQHHEPGDGRPVPPPHIDERHVAERDHNGDSSRGRASSQRTRRRAAKRPGNLPPDWVMLLLQSITISRRRTKEIAR